MFWILDELGPMIDELGPSEFDGLAVVTNNVAGMSKHMAYCRDHSEVLAAVPAILLPGVIEPGYSAVTGNLTERTLETIKADPFGTVFSKKTSKSDSPHFVGLSTGSWVTIGSDHFPAPLAHGVGQKGFKQKLMTVSDETFVVAPLGKILVEKTAAELNGPLGYGHQYEQISPPAHPRAVHLVTTSRPRHRVLTMHSANLASLLGDQLQHISKITDMPPQCDQICHFQLEFDLDTERSEEVKREFPHRGTRNDDFVADFFDVLDDVFKDLPPEERAQPTTR